MDRSKLAISIEAVRHQLVSTEPFKTAEADVAARKILVIDDSESMLNKVVEALRLEGYQCEGSPDLTPLDGRFTRFVPDLVLAELLLPELDGRDLCRTVKARFPDVDIPVYLMSSLPELELRARATTTGAAGYVSKRDGSTSFLSDVALIMQKHFGPPAGPEAGLQKPEKSSNPAPEK